MYINPSKYDITTKQENGKTMVFDPVRKIYVTLTPEEMIRQYIIQFLIQEKKVPASLMAVEMNIKFNEMQKRCDIVTFNKDGRAVLIVECKAPYIKLSQKTFEQIAGYNMALQVKYLLVSNGEIHYCYKIDFQNKTYTFLEDLPEYQYMK